MMWNSPAEATARLHAMTIAASGLRDSDWTMSDEATEVAVGLRLVTNLRIARPCHCVLLVGSTGSHSLSCKLE
jgi:hypothetical protein